nr:CD200-like protein [Betacoronavirus Erinaceus]
MNHLSICRLTFIVPVVVLCRAQVVVQNATVQLNKPASLRCTLQSSQEVLLVTWQKIKQRIPENMVTYSNMYGVQLQDRYMGKLNITQELRNSTITFWNITLEDQGCYNCFFNTYSISFYKLSGRPCLNIIAQPPDNVPVRPILDGDSKETLHKVGENPIVLSLLLSMGFLIILRVLISILYWKLHRHQEVGPEILALSPMGCPHTLK